MELYPLGLFFLFFEKQKVKSMHGFQKKCVTLRPTFHLQKNSV